MSSLRKKYHPGQRRTRDYGSVPARLDAVPSVWNTPGAPEPAQGSAYLNLLTVTQGRYGQRGGMCCETAEGKIKDPQKIHPRADLR
jgi:hypothetical protein